MNLTNSVIDLDSYPHNHIEVVDNTAQLLSLRQNQTSLSNDDAAKNESEAKIDEVDLCESEAV